MNEQIRTKLVKIYELVNNGATEGERNAAKKALDRIIERYQITEDDLQNIHLKYYYFKYSTSLELILLQRLMKFFTEDAFINSVRIRQRDGKKVKEIRCQVNYFDWITIETSYEYFRRHMKAEWKKNVLPELKRCRKSKTRNKRRGELEDIFMSNYIIASKLYKNDELQTVNYDSISDNEIADRQKLAKVKGGTYNKQVISNRLLNNA